MNRKKIAALPHEEAERTGKHVQASIVDGILILDCYESRKYIGRYCMQQKGKYDFWNEKERKWQIRKLCMVFGKKWYIGTEVSCSKESEAVIQDFFGETHYKADIRSIGYEETDYNRKKYEAAMGRKQDRIDKMMDLIPVLPDGFYQWLNDTVFGGEEYMFRTSETTWHCTACGKDHTSKKPYKHNQMVICSRTKNQVQAKNRDAAIRKKEPVVIFQEIDETKSTVRHFVAEKTWSKDGSKTEAYENVRYILGRGHDPWLIPKTIWYYGQENKADEFAQEWWDTNQSNKRCNAEYCYPIGVQEALKHTLYEGIHLEVFAELGWKIQYNKMMINQGMCGFMEYMAKAGLRKLTEEASEHFSTWYGFHDGDVLNINGDTAAEVLQVDAQRYQRVRRNNGGYRYLRWMQWEEMHKNIPEETVLWLDENSIDPDDVEFILDRMSPVQIKNYLSRTAKEYKKTPHSLLNEWKDYLSMAARAGLDVQDEIVYRAKHLLARHDELVEFLAQGDEDTWTAEVREKYPEVEKILSEVRGIYEYENENYILTVPEKVIDIIRDGRQLHHCAASSERYFGKISRQEIYIMFLRRKSRPLHAWYTLEVEPGGTVRQKRSEYNRQPEIGEVKKFISEWQTEIKKRLRKQDKELAKQAKTMRMMEMKELREKNERFAGVLEADLMEVG